jgi:hypothetical protein
VSEFGDVCYVDFLMDAFSDWQQNKFYFVVFWVRRNWEEGRRGGHSKAQKLKRRILQHILDLPM